VILFSLEMTSDQIMQRRLASHSGVYLTRIRYGDIQDSQWPDLIEAADSLSIPDPIIVDSPKFKQVERLTGYAQAIGKDKPVKLIIIDHVQKMNSSKKTQSRHLELSYVSERLCDLSKELHCPVIVLCQLRRNTEGKPKLEDLKESGDLEANADAVLGLYRPDKDSEVMEIDCLKYRNGPAGWTVYLKFDRYIQRFMDGEAPESTHYSAGRVF
jgi:replicative DNA helicase